MPNTYEKPAVIFEDNPYTSRQILGEHTQPLMLKLLMKTGWFRNERQAGLFLLGLVIVFMAVSVTIIKLGIFPRTPVSTSFEDLSFIETSQIDPVLLEALQD